MNVLSLMADVSPPPPIDLKIRKIEIRYWIKGSNGTKKDFFHSV